MCLECDCSNWAFAQASAADGYEAAPPVVAAPECEPEPQTTTCSAVLDVG